MIRTANTHYVSPVRLCGLLAILFGLTLPNALAVDRVAPSAAPVLTSVTVAIGGRRHPVRLPASDYSLEAVVWLTPTQEVPHFVTPVGVSVGGIDIGDVESSPERVTFRGPIGGKVLTAVFPESQPTEILLTTGDNQHFSVSLTRNARILTITSPVLSDTSTRSAAPGTPVTLRGDLFGTDVAANRIRVSLPDGRKFLAPVVSASKHAVTFATPLISVERGYYAGNCTVQVETAPGVATSPLLISITALPSVGPIGAATYHLIDTVRSTAKNIEDANSAALAAIGVSASDVSAGRQVPYAAADVLLKIVEDALAGRPQSFVMSAPNGPQLVVIDAATIGAFESVMSSSAALAEMDAARVHSEQLATLSSCGQTAGEADVRMRARTYLDLENASLLLGGASLASLVISGGTTTPLAALVFWTNILTTELQIEAGMAPISFAGYVIEPSSIAAVVGGGPRTVYVSGQFRPLFPTMLFDKGLNKVIEILVARLIARAVPGVEAPLELIKTAAELIVVAIPNDWKPRVNSVVPATNIPLSSMTLSVDSVELRKYADVSDLCNGELTVTGNTPAPVSIAVRIRSDFDPVEPRVEQSAIIPAEVRTLSDRLGDAGFSMTSGAQTAHNGEMLTMHVGAGQTGQVRFAATAVRSGTNLLWSLDSASRSVEPSFEATLGIGRHTVGLSVSDSAGNRITSVGTIIVAIAPVAPFAAFIAKSGGSVAASNETLGVATSSGTAAVDFSGAVSFDPLGGALTYAWSADGQPLSSTREFTSNFGVGDHHITLTVTSSVPLSRTATGIVHVFMLATSAPVVSQVAPRSTIRGNVTLNIDGSRFDTTTALVELTGPGCAPCVPWITSRSATKIIAQKEMSTTGTYDLGVRNGVSGVLSNTMPVSITGESAVTLHVDPMTISLTAIRGEKTAAPLLITSGAERATWAATTAGGTWLRISAANGTTPSSIGVIADVTSIGSGVYAGYVDISDAVGGRTRIPVSLQVIEGSSLLISPTSWSPVFTVGQSAASLPVQIKSSTGTPMTGTVSASTVGAWPAAQLKVNGLATYGWVAPETVMVTADSTGLGAGTYTGSLTVSSTSATNTPVRMLVTMTIYSAVQITTTSLPDAVGGVSYSGQLQASGGSGGYTWTVAGGTLPVGLLLDGGKGTISGTPASISGNTTYIVTFTVHDSLGHSATKTFSIVYQEGLAIQALSPSNFQFVVGTPYTNANSVRFEATGGAAPYTWSATGMPPGLSVNATSGYITGTPTTAGSFPASVSVTDAKSATANRSFTLAVVTVPLTISPTSLPTGTVGAAYSQYIQAQGGTQSVYVWSTTGSLPPGITAVKAPGCTNDTCAFQVSGMPTAAGSYMFTAKVTDSGNNSAQQTFTVIINSGTPPSITTGKLPKATIGSSFSTALTATGGSGSGYQWTLISSPDPGLHLSSSGVLSGTPTVPNDCSSGALDGSGGLWTGSPYVSQSIQVKVTDSVNQSTNQQLCLVSYYPTPRITGFMPASLTIDGNQHPVTVNGGEFRSDAMLLTAANATLTSLFGTSTALNITLYPAFSPAFTTTPGGSGQVDDGTTSMKVLQPYSEHSNTDKTLVVYAPVPTLTTVQAVLPNTTQPCYVNVTCQLVVSGTGLYSKTEYLIKETSTQLTKSTYPSTPAPWTQVSTSNFSMTSAGTYTVRITNRNQPSGEASAELPFDVASVH